MGRAFVRGDNHGNFEFLQAFCEENNTSVNDVLIILGDVGFNYYKKGSNLEKRLKKNAAEYPISILCIRGNHEDRPQNRGIEKEYKKIGPIEGVVYWEPDYPNIYYAVDGEVYKSDGGKSILAIGGAYSVDKFYRLIRGYSWFKDEQLTQEEMQHITEVCGNKKYNYVFTHTCPYEWQPVDLFLSGIDFVDSTMEKWLSELNKTISYDKWFFGHYHADREDIGEDGKGVMLFNKIVEIDI